jgi:hypothetical protein
MRRTHLVMVVAIVLVTSLLLGAQKQAKQWEYARLSYGYGRGVRWSWTAPGVSVEGGNVNELCKKLAIKIPANGAETFVVADWAGSRGWELVIMESIESESAVAAWFKRQK